LTLVQTNSWRITIPRCATREISFPTPTKSDTHPWYRLVTTTLKNNVQMNNPICFRTYVARDRPDEKPVKIWEAIRATSAAPTYFDSITINGEEYIDGGFGCNNPSRVVYNEARKIWPGRDIGCVISIGTGIPKVQAIPKLDLSYWFRSFWVLPFEEWFQMVKLAVIGWMDILQRVATNCDLVHQKMLEDLDWHRNYFRFNIQQGAQDIPLAAWKALPNLVTHTEQCVSRFCVLIKRC
jgi:Patatin-like phospholipase